MAPRTEFSRRIVVEPWPQGGIAVELEASAEERRALVRRFGLLELSSLTAVGTLERSSDDGEIRFRAQLGADVAQACVISLEPVTSHISEPIERRYRPLPANEGAAAPEVMVDPEAVDVEPLPEPLLDLGEVVAEELGLALDPYPRVGDAYGRLPDLGPDVSLGDTGSGASPFAVLEELYNNKRAR